MTWRDRVLSDGIDKEEWLAARAYRLGASDAKSWSKVESIPLYLHSKLKDGNWGGNTYTRSGHDWEPRMLAWAGIPHNTALIHADGEPGFVATPDGIRDRADGSILLAECKARHEGKKWQPSLGERRQIAWAQYVAGPEALESAFIAVQVDPEGNPLDLEPHIQLVPRDELLIERLLTIARPLLAQLDAARAFEREIA